MTRFPLRALAGLALLAAAPVVYQTIVSTRWRMRRMLAFLDPWQYRYDYGYQAPRAQVASGAKAAAVNQGPAPTAAAAVQSGAASGVVLECFADSGGKQNLLKAGDFSIQLGPRHAPPDLVLSPENQRLTIIAMLQQVFGVIQSRFGKPASTRHPARFAYDILTSFAKRPAKIP